MEEESGRIHVDSNPDGLELYIIYDGGARYHFEDVKFKSWLDRRPFDVRMEEAAQRLRDWNTARLSRISLAAQWERRLNEGIDILPKNRL